MQFKVSVSPSIKNFTEAWNANKTLDLTDLHFVSKFIESVSLQLMAGCHPSIKVAFEDASIYGQVVPEMGDFIQNFLQIFMGVSLYVSIL